MQRLCQKNVSTIWQIQPFDVNLRYKNKAGEPATTSTEQMYTTSK